MIKWVVNREVYPLAGGSEDQLECICRSVGFKKPSLDVNSVGKYFRSGIGEEVQGCLAHEKHQTPMIAIGP